MSSLRDEFEISGSDRPVDVVCAMDEEEET
jgi:hypothetical protein